jgi:hypothetical protein
MKNLLVSSEELINHESAPIESVSKQFTIQNDLKIKDRFSVSKNAQKRKESKCKEPAEVVSRSKKNVIKEQVNDEKSEMSTGNTLNA